MLSKGDDSKPCARRRQGKIAVCKSQQGGRGGSDTGLAFTALSNLCNSASASGTENFTSRNNKENKSYLLLTCRLIRSDSGKGKSGLPEHPPLSCHPKYFKVLTGGRISKQLYDHLHLPLPSLPQQPQALDR